MKSLNDIIAEEIMEKEFPSVSPDEKLSKIKTLMEEENVREIPVMDGKKFKGMVNHRKIQKNLHKDPTNITARTLLHQPPNTGKEDTLIDIADLRRNSGSKTVVVLEGNRLKGVIGDDEIVSALTNSVKEFHNLRVNDIMNREVVTLKEQAKYDKADDLMRVNDFSRIPIVDGKDRIMGVISTTGILKTMVPKEQMSQGDFKGFKENMSDVPVREIMNTQMALVKDVALPVSKAVKKMNKFETREAIVINENDKPIGILTKKDLVDYMATFMESEDLMVNLVGSLTDSQKEMVYSKIENVVKGKISRLLNRPRELKIHVKQYDTEGKNMKFSVNLKLYSELGTTIIHKHGWDLMDVIDEVLDGVKEKLTTQKQKRRDRIREQWRKGKYNK